MWLVHRSPWSNEYDPPLDDGTLPSTKLRKLEVTANEAFDTYREMFCLVFSTMDLLRLQFTCAIGTLRVAFHPYSSGILRTVDLPVWFS